MNIQSLRGLVDWSTTLRQWYRHSGLQSEVRIMAQL